jgi:HAMP domain-containing protein
VTAAGLLRFPNPVNEVAARVVAGGVAAGAWITLGTRWPWLLPFVAYGFLARVLTGPTLSPLGQLATRVVAPRLAHPKPVPGPPKRFAQGIGAVVSSAAAILWFVFGLQLPALGCVALLGVASTLESVFAFCIGCRVFDLLMRAGVVPPTICEACSNLALARPQA